jgi:hypothetical protein
VSFCEVCLDGPRSVSGRVWQNAPISLSVRTGLPVSPNPCACPDGPMSCPDRPCSEFRVTISPVCPY